jgi:predicted  nucleic acid-binding Zn-ribbon protein
MSIWVPKDAKASLEIQIKIDSTRFSITRFKHQIEQKKLEIRAFSDLLRDMVENMEAIKAEGLIVSLGEVKVMQTEQRAVSQKIALIDAEHKHLKVKLQAEMAILSKLEKELVESSFKLLEFKIVKPRK